MTNKQDFIEKELSWLSFNERVLQEAADANVPIVERVRFLGIYSNNMDEFFRVRVADVKRKIFIKKDQGEDASEDRELLKKIQKKVIKLGERFDEIYIHVLKCLARRNIFLINEQQLSPEQGEWVNQYFKDNVLQYINPIMCEGKIDLAQVLDDDITYLAVELIRKGESRYSLVEVPSDDMSRFIELPRIKGQKRRCIIMLDNIIRYSLKSVFKGNYKFDEIHAYSMKMTRDAEYGLSEDIDQSLLEQMSLSIKQRMTAEPVRFVYDREMPKSTLNYLLDKIGISNYDAVIPGGRYHNFRDFISFPNIGRNYLEYSPLPRIESKKFAAHKSSFQAISEGDILLYYPYHKFNHFTEFVRQASYDPKVEHISISIYRVAKKSRIIDALINAAKNGKNVRVVVELRARFDEEANIEWAKVLTDAGIKVDFGVPALKCHTKLCLIGRNESDGYKRYAHIGTGNFHEKTARIYTDFSLFTCHDEITAEVEDVFNFIRFSYKHYHFKHLIVSPNDFRPRVHKLIDREIKHAEKGLTAEIMLKVNNLVDDEVVGHLYKASQAGVKIRIIIRGMCTLLPGVKGLSDNIKVISIVDRFLEHPRVSIFSNQGEHEIYISSADWMTRNIDHRVEVGCPVYNKQLQKQILDIFEIQWSDTTKARIIDAKQTNQYKPRGNKRKIQSQLAIHDYIAKLEK
ncbi:MULTISPECIES: polyphosphate kinase 1 [unclassified Oleiphilus]|jgi:polyphosphate kinase|nr:MULTISPECIES: polyphosphate kinase 1 [unclassified Oleiphilus]KZY37841.1 RNA degradosome polyphosphate kinase [Oleiphilus sp. HI0043]KZZ71973.1 RNA degradosome polyphosphate kinase [Oleiphilus sp. HI0128]